MMTSLSQILQYFAWFIALIEAIACLYWLLLNYRRSANRYVGLFFSSFLSMPLR